MIEYVTMKEANVETDITTTDLMTILEKQLIYSKDSMDKATIKTIISLLENAKLQQGADSYTEDKRLISTYIAFYSFSQMFEFYVRIYLYKNGEIEKIELDSGYAIQSIILKYIDENNWG